MAKNARYSDEARNAKADALVALLDDGYLRIYDDGAAQPSDPDTAVPGGSTLLAELRFANPAAAGPAAAGVVTFDAIAPDASADDTGTALWFRALKADGTSPVLDGSVGAGGTFDIVLNSTSVVTGVEVAVTSLTYTEPTN
jgi:hypothetical protein